MPVRRFWRIAKCWVGLVRCGVWAGGRTCRGGDGGRLPFPCARRGYAEGTAAESGFSQFEFEQFVGAVVAEHRQASPETSTLAARRGGRAREARWTCSGGARRGPGIADGGRSDTGADGVALDVAFRDESLGTDLELDVRHGRARDGGFSGDVDLWVGGYVLAVFSSG